MKSARKLLKLFKLSRSQGISVAILASSLGLAIAASVPNVFTAGSLLSATAMNANFTALVNAVTTAETTLATKANSADVYTKTETDTALATKANTADVYTKTQIDASVANAAKAAGLVNSDGTVSTGFVAWGTYTITKGAAGIYTINLAGLRPGCTPDWPMAVMVPWFAGTASFSVGSTACGSGDTTWTVVMRNSAFAAADGSFQFVLYAPPSAALPPVPAARPAYTVCRIESTGVETCE